MGCTGIYGIHGIYGIYGNIRRYTGRYGAIRDICDIRGHTRIKRRSSGSQRSGQIARADLVQTWMRWHKHVLSAASPYFRTMLLSYLEEGSRVSYIRGACGDVANDGRRATVADRGRQQRRGGEPTSRAWSLEQWEVSAQGLFPFRLA